jgi:hypothetical protein
MASFREKEGRALEEERDRGRVETGDAVKEDRKKAGRRW